MPATKKERTIEEDFIFQITTKLRNVEYDLLIFRHTAIDSKVLANLNTKLLELIHEFEPE